MLHPCPDSSQEELRPAPCTVRASSNASWHTGSQLFLQPDVDWKSQYEKVLFTASAQNPDMWGLESARTRSTALPQIKAQLWQGSRTRCSAQLHFSPSLWPAVCPCWLCSLLLHSLICALMPWHPGTESLYICPRQLKINNRVILSLEASLLSSP